jgi:hypothetical protein
MLIYLLGCQEKALPLESIDSTSENNAFSKQGGIDDPKKLNQIASSLIVRAQEKITKAEEEYNKALDGRGVETVELKLMRKKIDDAIRVKNTAKNLKNLNQYKLSAIYSKKSMKLANQALQFSILLFN